MFGPLTNVGLSPRSVDLLCSVKYENELPDIPFDPKFLTYPFDSQRYNSYVVAYKCFIPAYALGE